VNKQQPEPHLAEIQRHPLLLIISLLVMVTFAWPAWLTIRSVNPWGFLMMGPALFAGFHALWLILNPFAWIYADRIEIRPTWFHNHLFYFKDITHAQLKENYLYITYTDGEVARISILGISKSETESILKTFSQHH